MPPNHLQQRPQQQLHTPWPHQPAVSLAQPPNPTCSAQAAHSPTTTTPSYLYRKRNLLPRRKASPRIPPRQRQLSTPAPHAQPSASKAQTSNPPYSSRKKRRSSPHSRVGNRRSALCRSSDGLSGSGQGIIGDQVPRKEDGSFDANAASLYWRTWYAVDSCFGTDFCGVREAEYDE